MLAPLGIELVPRPDDLPDVVEDAPTLEGNARLKAVAVCDATGQPALADDTGLEVDALGGAPGVFSARYAGDDASYTDNVAKLLDALADLPDPEERMARFRTVALVRFPTDARWWPPVGSTARSRAPPGAPTASGTTRCSSRSKPRAERSPSSRPPRRTASATALAP